MSLGGVYICRGDVRLYMPHLLAYSETKSEQYWARRSDRESTLGMWMKTTERKWFVVSRATREMASEKGIENRY